MSIFDIFRGKKGEKSQKVVKRVSLDYTVENANKLIESMGVEEIKLFTENETRKGVTKKATRTIRSITDREMEEGVKKVATPSR
jgi:hypothetical protein